MYTCNIKGSTADCVMTKLYMCQLYGIFCHHRSTVGFKDKPQPTFEIPLSQCSQCSYAGCGFHINDERFFGNFFVFSLGTWLRVMIQYSYLNLYFNLYTFIVY